jgi:serine phosphatase RsbU (regulator of sigma subunit)
MLYLTTDGIIDQNGPSRKRYGTPKLLEMITQAAALPLEEQKSLLEASLSSHQEQEEQRDDITLMGIRL